MMKNRETIEFSFWEAGCLIWVGAKDLGGLSYHEICQLIWGGSLEKIKTTIFEQKIFLPMNLYQDDGYHVRVVMGELNTQEAEEWVARVRWKLNLSCGQMVVSGIADDDEDEFINMAAATEKNPDALQCYVEVTPGEYQVEIYSYPPGDLSTGWGQITDPSLFPPQAGIEPESVTDYFFRTRPQEEAPPWIAYEITEDKQKKSEYYQAAVDADYVNFVVRLSPVIDDLPTPTLESDGCIAWEFRKPEKCPLGIVGKKDV
jgi:hypothetical protein